AHRRPAEDPGRDRQGLRRHPGADPPDRVQDDVQAAASEPVPGAAGLPRLIGARFGTDCPPARAPIRALSTDWALSTDPGLELRLLGTPGAGEVLRRPRQVRRTATHDKGSPLRSGEPLSCSPALKRPGRPAGWVLVGRPDLGRVTSAFVLLRLVQPLGLVVDV